jgi:hypothetical protein
MRMPFARGAAWLTAGIVAAAFGTPAAAADPAKPELGAGPHRDWQGQLSGEGERPRQGAPEPKLPEPARPADASGGASAAPAGPEDARSEQEQKEDERKATESKEKMKKKPGYQEEVPSPRAETPRPPQPN